MKSLIELAIDSLDMELLEIFPEYGTFSEDRKNILRERLQTIRKKRCKNDLNLLTITRQ